MKTLISRIVGSLRMLFRLLGLSALGTLIFTSILAIKHTLETPQPLESLLPGEAHLYRWKYGYISYKVLGEVESPPLLLLHTPGLAASAHEMAEIMAPLASHFQVYAPDLPGFGLSDRPNIAYSSALYGQLCQDFLREVIGRPAIVVASRLSCNYALEVAAETPELCTRLVLLSPLALHGDQPPEARLSSRIPAGLLEATPVKTLLFALLSEGIPLIASLGGKLSRGDEQERYIYATTHQFGAEHAVTALLAGKLVRDVSPSIDRVQQPTLLIWGADALQDMRSIDSPRDAAWGPAHTQLVLLQHAGLPVHEELPQAVIKTIEQWSVNGSAPKTAPAAPRKASENVGESAFSAAQSTPRTQPATERTTNEAAEETPMRNTPVVVEAYCVRCKKKTPMLDPREVTMKNGRIAVQGTCSICGANLFRIGRLVPGYPHTPV